MNAPNRPVLRWHGGKWRLAPWIIQHFPPHRLYTEAFGGAASVLLRKPRSYAEIYGDLDGDVVNLFQVLRSDRAPDLIAGLRLTPFARAEFELAYEVSADPVEEARRLVVRSFMGFGSDGFNRDVTTGFRANAHRSGTTPAQDWMNLPDALALTVERLRGVVVERRDALEMLAQHDAPDALHYLDPPYLPETRSQEVAEDRRAVSRLPARDDRQGPRPAVAGLAGPARHGGALRLPCAVLRRGPRRLDPSRARRPCRRRPGSHRGPVDQPTRSRPASRLRVGAGAGASLRGAGMSLRAQTLHDPYLVGNGRWCSCCFPAGPPVEWNGRAHARLRRGCNECAGAGRIVFTAEEIVARTVAEARAHRRRNP